MQLSSNPKVGELLVQEGLLTREQVEQAHAAQKVLRSSLPFGEVCTELGFLSPTDLEAVLCKHHQRIPLGGRRVHIRKMTLKQVQFALEQQK